MKTAARKISRSIVIEIRGRSGLNYERERDVPRYKLNNVCDSKRVRKPHQSGAQISDLRLLVVQPSRSSDHVAVDRDGGKC